MVACSQDSAELYRSAKLLYRDGHFGEATRQAERGYSRYQGKPQSEWRWKFGILAAELELLSGNTSRADTFLSSAPPAHFAFLIPRYEMLRGYSLYRHNSAQGQELLKHAIADAQVVGDTETLDDAWLYLGISQLSGDLAAADAAFQRAQQLAEASHLEYQRAAALVNRGYIEILRQHYATAIPLLEAAREVASQAHAGFLGTFALDNLGICYESLGNLDQALATLESSVDRQKHFGLATSLSNDYSELGVIHQRKGETAEAIRYFRQAFEVVSKDAPFEYSLSAGNLANALEQMGALDEAEHFNRIALTAADPKDNDLVGHITLTEAAIAERRGHYDQAVTIYQKALSIGNAAPSTQWQAYAGLAGVYSAQGDFSNADKNYARALAVIAVNRADQLKSDYKITFLSNLIRFYQDYVALLIQHGDSNRALEIADSSRASVLTEDLLGETSRPALLPQIQKAARTSRSIFLFYWLAPKSSYLWAISGAQSKAVPLSDQQQISQDVASYRALIEQEKRDPLARSSGAGARLYQELIAPVSALVPRGSRVVVVPDGVLHNLNFETLLVPSPEPHFWIEDVTISIAPSLGILQAGKTRLSARRSLLLMGNPVTQGTGYPPLPEAALEIAKVQRQFPASQSTVLTGPQAVVDAYSAAQPGRFSTIHFATHVDANAQSPLDSSIILSPQPNGFRLYARDVAQMPLHADLVTISACRGAGARALSGEGLVGFAWAFFQARAQNVVTSLWDVYDNSTAQLMDDFYSGVAAGHSYADSLREAKLKMLHSNYQRPYYWAPFQLYSRSIF